MDEVIFEAKDYEFGDSLNHYGTPRHSGRYPWGSGDDPYQHYSNLRRDVKKLKDEGLKETEIAKALGYRNTTELRNRVSAAANYIHKENIATAVQLKSEGLSTSEIGRRMGINESSVRSLLDPKSQANAKVGDVAKDILRSKVDEKEYIDVGKGSEHQLGISKQKLNTVVAQLRDEEGYTTHDLYVEQAGNPGRFTTVRVLAKPGVDIQEVYKNMEKISTINDRRPDDEVAKKTDLNMKPPVSIDSSRIQIKYNEEGGKDKDGVIEIRRGAEDLNLGNASYAQVRIAVDGTHYLKGMAIYKDDMPDGVDVIYNSNKHVGTDPKDVFKKMKTDAEGNIDKDNPFGAAIKKQLEYDSFDGTKKQSAINIVNEEGDWGEWAKAISSQMLGKQPVELIKRQLKLTYDERKAEFDEINSLTNPVIKREMLLDFANNCDAAAVHLKAAALPRQAAHVILPITSLKDNEIYAPNYKDGETVVLIRFPHAGRFEIPELRVNNGNKEARSVMFNATDAVGINSKVAERLSGADFDGDTVLVIPNNDRSIKTSSPLRGLKDFDTKEAYPAYEGMPKVGPKTGFNKQMQMGLVSNLITDMTLKGAKEEELARAVKHSMVVIDAEKHNLNWRKSETDNGIPELKAKYQNNSRGGSSTLLSRAKNEVRVDQRQLGYSIDPETGQRVYKETGKTYRKYNYKLDDEGNRVYDGSYADKKYTTVSTKMNEANTPDEVRKLSSGTRQEEAYASYAIAMKAMANEARKNSLGLKQVKNTDAAKEYHEEVLSIDNKIRIAQSNSPYERKAQLIAGSIAKAKIDANPGLSKEEQKRIRNQAITVARARVGASKVKVDLTDKEWEAIQKGAITDNKLKAVWDNCDKDTFKQRAMPRTNQGISPAKVSLAKSLSSRGYSIKDIADHLGVSTSTVSKALKS